MTDYILRAELHVMDLLEERNIALHRPVNTGLRFSTNAR